MIRLALLVAALLSTAACGSGGGGGTPGGIDLELTLAEESWFTAPPDVTGAAVASPGVLIPLNSDDSDGDGTADNTDTDVDGAPDARQLLVLTVNELLNGTPGDKVRLYKKSGSGTVRVFGRTSSAAELFVSTGTMSDTDAAQLFTDAYAADTPLYVEGVSTGDVELCAKREGSRTGEACAKLQVIPSLKPRVMSDTNRDGSATDADLTGRETWTLARGAIVFANGDADCSPAANTADAIDATIACATDEADVGRLRLDQRVVDLTGATGWKTILRTRAPENPGPTPEAALVGVFTGTASGATLVPWTETSKVGGVVTFEMDVSAFTTMDKILGIEAVTFDVDVDLELCAVHTSGAQSACDKTIVHASPLILQSNLERVSTVAYSRQTGVNNNDALKLALETALGVPNVVSSGVSDVWTQDEIEIGGINSPRGAAQCVIALPRGQGLRTWAINEAKADVAVVDLAGVASAVPANFGGNLEVTPSTASAPGYVVPGNNMAPNLVGALRTMWTSYPGVIEADVSWLAVGHVDEVAAIIPTASGWGVVVASTDLATKLIDGTEPGITAPLGRAALFWHCNGTPRSQAASCYSHGTVTGAVAKVGAARARISATGAGFTSDHHWLRIYSGTGRGQVAHIASVVSSTTVEVDAIFDFPKALDARCAALSAIPFVACDIAPTSTASVDSWVRLPVAGDRIVVVQETLDMRENAMGTMPSKLPGLYTVAELRDHVVNAEFYAAQTAIQPRLEQTVTNFTAAFPAVQVIRVPVFYGVNGVSGGSLAKGEAWTPNAANIQIVQLSGGSTVLIPMQFGPSVGATDTFTTYLNLKLPGTRVHVDDFYTYHVNFGDVHCGTNFYKENELRWWP